MSPNTNVTLSWWHTEKIAQGVQQSSSTCGLDSWFLLILVNGMYWSSFTCQLAEVPSDWGVRSGMWLRMIMTKSNMLPFAFINFINSLLCCCTFRLLGISSSMQWPSMELDTYKNVLNESNITTIQRYIQWNHATQSIQNYNTSTKARLEQQKQKYVPVCWCCWMLLALTRCSIMAV